MNESGVIQARAVPSSHSATIAGLGLQHRPMHGTDNVETYLRYVLPLDGSVVVGVVGSVDVAKRDGGTELRRSPAEFKASVAGTSV